MNLGSLVYGIKAKNAAFKQAMNESKNKIRELDDQAERSRQRMRRWGAAITTAAVAATAAVTNMAANFQEGMSEVQTLLGPESQDRMREFEDSVKQTSKETGKSLDDVTRGLYQVVSAFGDTEHASDQLNIATRAARAGVAATTDAVNLLSAVTKGYGDTTAEAVERAADLAFQTVRLGQTTFPELASSMGRVIPLASTLRVAQEELFGAMATLTGVTGSTAEVSTQLRSALQALLSPTDRMRQTIRSLGFEGGEMMIQALGLQGTLQALADTTDGNNELLSEMFGRAEALNAVLALTGSQADVFTEKTMEMYDAAGSMNEAFEIQMNNVNALRAQIRQMVQVALVDIGDRYLPIVERASRAILDIPEPLQRMATTAGLLATSLGLIVGPLGLIVGYLPQIKAGLLALKGGFAPFLVGGVVFVGITLLIDRLIQLRHEAALALRDVRDVYTARHAKEQREAIENQIKIQEDRLQQIMRDARVDRATALEILGEEFQARLDDLYKQRERNEKRITELTTEEERKRVDQAILETAREFRNKVRLGEMTKDKLVEFLEYHVDNTELSTDARAQMAMELKALKIEQEQGYTGAVEKEAEQRIREERSEYQARLAIAKRQHGEISFQYQELAKEYSLWIKDMLEQDGISYELKASLLDEYLNNYGDNMTAFYEALHKERIRSEKSAFEEKLAFLEEYGEDFGEEYQKLNTEFRNFLKEMLEDENLSYSLRLQALRLFRQRYQQIMKEPEILAVPEPEDPFRDVEVIIRPPEEEVTPAKEVEDPMAIRRREQMQVMIDAQDIQIEGEVDTRPLKADLLEAGEDTRTFFDRAREIGELAKQDFSAAITHARNLYGEKIREAGAYLAGRAGDAGEFIMHMATGNWHMAIMQLIAGTESFQKISEALNGVFSELLNLAEPFVRVIAQILVPVLEFFAGVIRGVANAIIHTWNFLLELVSLIPGINLRRHKLDPIEDTDIDTPDEPDPGPEPGRPTTPRRTAGAVITAIPGAVRDELRDLLRPLSALIELPGYMDRLLQKLDPMPDQIGASVAAHLGNMELAQAGESAAAPVGSISVERLADRIYLSDHYPLERFLTDVNRLLGLKIKMAKRGKGRRNG